MITDVSDETIDAETHHAPIGLVRDILIMITCDY
jgi:hypothetical protein